MNRTEDIQMAVEERRRSDRLWLTLPVRVEGIDCGGQAFDYSGRARNLSRHGARIQIPRALETGQTIRLKSPMGHFEAKFRVVDAIPASGEDGGEYGLECLDESENFWGIQFPSVEESMTAEAKGLLECRICHSLAMMPLTLWEVETLRSIGVVGKPCQSCAGLSPWRYAEVRVPVNRVAEGMVEESADARARWFAAAAEPIERGHRRAYMQLPLGIRDAQGAVEVTRTENISRCGFSFVSDRTYLQGEIVMVVCPLDSSTQNIELAARIVRQQELDGGHRNLYGATFEPQKCAAGIAA